MVALTSPPAASVDLCGSGNTSNPFIALSGTSCFEFSSGVPGTSISDTTSNSCTETEAYAYKSIQFTPIRTAVLLQSEQTSTNAYPYPTLSIGFMDSPPPDASTIESSVSKWYSAGDSSFSYLFDLKDDSPSAYFIVLKFECTNGSTCKKTNLYVLSCYEDELVDPSMFHAEYNSGGLYYPTLNVE